MLVTSDGQHDGEITPSLKSALICVVYVHSRQITMAYLPGLTNDIFISYAHADNTEGWVDQFHERLFNRLRQLDRSAPFTIWRDRKLTRADVFTDEIYGQLASSGVLISILSPNGLDSSWCQQERERFERAARSTGGLRLGNKIRAIKVTKTPSAGDRHKDIFGTLGYEFYRRDAETHRFNEFHPTSPEFDGLMQEISQEVYELLQQLHMLALSRIPNLTVYVATVSSDLKPLRTRVVDELAAWNCRIYPEASLASELSKNVIMESLGSSSISVHCVGPTRCSTLEDETLPIDALQLTCARNTEISRIVCQVGQPHTAVQEALKQTATRGSEDLICPETPDRLLQFLEDRVSSLRKTGVTIPDALPTVYVVCNISEWDEALRLKACLEGNSRFAAVLPIREVDDKSVRRRDHRDTLKNCQAALVYWGANSSESWFREEQREVIKARLKRRNRPLPALCLSSAPRTEAQAEAYNRPDLPFQQVPDLDCSKLRPLFRHLQGDRI